MNFTCLYYRAWEAHLKVVTNIQSVGYYLFWQYSNSITAVGDKHLMLQIYKFDYSQNLYKPKF